MLHHDHTESKVELTMNLPESLVKWLVQTALVRDITVEEVLIKRITFADHQTRILFFECLDTVGELLGLWDEEESEAGEKEKRH